MDEACFTTGIISNGKRVRIDGDYVFQQIIPREVLVHINRFDVLGHSSSR